MVNFLVFLESLWWVGFLGDDFIISTPNVREIFNFEELLSLEINSNFKIKYFFHNNWALFQGHVHTYNSYLWSCSHLDRQHKPHWYMCVCVCVCVHTYNSYLWSCSHLDRQHKPHWYMCVCVFTLTIVTYDLVRTWTDSTSHIDICVCVCVCV
jgi:hypothetical protein